MTDDPDEIELSKLAKRVLSMPPKKRDESKVGRKPKKPKTLAQKKKPGR